MNHNKLANSSRVRLLTDKYCEEGLGQGALGYIIEVYAEAYEVEFSDDQGVTIAIIVAYPEDIDLDEPAI